MTSNKECFRDQDILSEYPIFRAESADQASQKISEIFSPYQLNVKKAADKFGCGYNGIFFGNFSVVYSWFDADVELVPRVDSFCCVQSTLWGSAQLKHRSGTVALEPGSLTVVNSAPEYKQNLTGHCGRLMMVFERTALEHHLSQLMRRDLGEKLSFSSGKIPTGGKFQIWNQTLSYLISNIAEIDESMNNASYIQHMGQMLMSLLLETQKCNYTEQLKAGSITAGPQYVRRAIDYVHGNLQSPISIVALCNETGVSARALQKGFIRYIGSTPSEYIRSAKRRAVHGALLEASPEQHVGVILTKYGVTSYGHFSQAYKKSYGCTPSETLRDKIGFTPTQRIFS